jgi:hypothetical protein
MILEAVAQALTHHYRTNVSPVGDTCACGALVAAGDWERHAARKVLDAINDIAGENA